jgi:hypothetical protein
VLRRQPEFEWVRDGTWLDSLVGTTRVRAALEGGASVDEIVSADAAGIERFRRERRAILLY